MTKRIGLVAISKEFFFKALLSWYLHKMRKEPPEDMIMEDLYYDWKTETLFIRVSSEEFPEVEVGMTLPIIHDYLKDIGG